MRSGLEGLVINEMARAEALALGGEAEMRRRIRTELDDVARKRALQGYEIPRDFLIDREPFSKANHLLTDSGKPATGRLRNKCAPRKKWVSGSVQCIVLLLVARKSVKRKFKQNFYIYVW